MRYHTWHAASSWGCRYQRDEAMTHSTPDDAPTVALLLTCLARRAIRSAVLRVFACQTATKRYHTWHAASSLGCRYQRDEAMTHGTLDDASTVALLLTCLARRANERTHSADLRRVFACQTATMRYHTWHAASIRALGNHAHRPSSNNTPRIRTKPGSHSKASVVSSRFPCLTCRALCAVAHARVRLVLACPSTDTRAYSQDTATPP